MWSGSDIIGDLYFKGKDNQLAFGSDDGAPITQYIWGDGDLDFGIAGTYTVRVTPTAADRLDVAKTARLTGAVLRVNAMASDLYAETQRYTILHAGEKFNGTRFAGVTSNLAYLTPTLSYSDDDQDAFLTLVRKAAPAPVPVPPVIEPVPPATNPAPPVTDPVPPTTEPVPPASDPASPPATDAATPGDDGAAPSSPIRFADLLSNRNTIATANAIESLPADHELYRRALSLPEGAPQAYFSALAGEIHASVRHALPGLDTTIRDVPLKHLRANLNAGRHAGSPTAAAGVSDAPPAASTLPGSDAHPAWAQLVGSWQDQGATDDSNAVRLRTGGIFIGVDHAIGAGWRLGGALGYTDSQLHTDGANAKSNISSYSAIAYGGKAFETRGGRLNVLLGSAYTWHNVDTRRGVMAGALDQTLRADYRASATQLFAELGYALAASGALSVEPYAGLAWASQRSSAFQERGGSGALSGVGQSARTTTTTLGARLRHALQSGGFDGALTVGAGWRRAFGDLSTTSTQSFDAGDAFTIVGAPIARDTLLLETGLQARTGRNAMAGFHYAGQFSSRNRNHGATLTWRWAF
ncbi:autotransporter [Achromobacter xylosoxidans]|nr:autotransporter [Achromobacter xylosoxidans]KOQ27800.1 autotransporter [Achromobacter xylosoxidans]KOQ32755.1 autotransporter [Achromobacter xylosoxidans]KOQ44421.1 autotransporter [Achromobacter xylosoxidans]KOQ49701.1 autotransporter [Achromobacter xylosoxidans]